MRAIWRDIAGARPRRLSIRAFALASFLVASVGLAQEAQARVTIQFSGQIADALRSQGRDPDAEEARLNANINAGLEALAPTDAAAKALFDSGQTIRIVCFGSGEANDRELTQEEGLLGPTLAETRGDFDANGNPVAGGRAFIAVDCEFFATRPLDTPIFDIDPASSYFLILIHELLHASNEARQHPPDSLDIYEAFVQNFVAALRRLASPPFQLFDMGPVPDAGAAPAGGGGTPGGGGATTPGAGGGGGATTPGGGGGGGGAGAGGTQSPRPPAPQAPAVPGSVGFFRPGAPVNWALDARLAYSVVNVDNTLGIGTVVTGGGENFVAELPDWTSRFGFELSARANFGGIGFFGGSNALFASFAYAGGETLAEGTETVGTGGVTAVGLTFLYPDGVFGTGIGSMVAGDQLVGSARYQNQWAEGLFGYYEYFRAGPSNNLGVQLYAGLALETVQQHSVATADIVRLGTSLVSQTTTIDLSNRYVGAHFAASFAYPVTDNLKVSVGGYLAPLFNNTWGEIMQFTDFAGGIDQQLDYRDLSLAYSMGAEFRVIFEPILLVGQVSNFQISAGVEFSRLSGVATAIIPANPGETAGFGRDVMDRTFFHAGFNFRF